MKIKVIGKAHMEGTSKKTGNPYNFHQIHYNAPSRGVEGVAAKTLNLDPSMAAYAAIQVGGEYNVEFDERGYVTAFEAVKG